MQVGAEHEGWVRSWDPMCVGATRCGSDAYGMVSTFPRPEPSCANSRRTPSASLAEHWQRVQQVGPRPRSQVPCPGLGRTSGGKLNPKIGRRRYSGSDRPASCRKRLQPPISQQNILSIDRPALVLRGAYRTAVFPCNQLEGWQLAPTFYLPLTL